MTYKISIEALGQLGPDGFARLIAERIATLKEYDAHEAIVRQHAANPDMPDEERYTTLAVPAAAVEVDSAIRRIPKDDGTTDFVADYELVGPVGPSFETKKSRLFDQVSAAERDAMIAIVPPGKIRAFQFREADIRKADQARYTAEMAKGPTEPIDFARFNITSRPAADTHFMEEQAAREDQRNEIMRWAAQLHSDIEDLTAETIDAWKMKPCRTDNDRHGE